LKYNLAAHYRLASAALLLAVLPVADFAAETTEPPDPPTISSEPVPAEAATAESEDESGTAVRVKRPSSVAG
jgi:hypothetical protein